VHCNAALWPVHELIDYGSICLYIIYLFIYIFDKRIKAKIDVNRKADQEKADAD
jgi:uncharacterized membrane protein